MTTRSGPTTAVMVAAGLALATALLTGCGSDDAGDTAQSAATDSASSASSSAATSDAPTTEPTTEPTSEPTSEAPTTPEIPAGTPDCASVWTEGARIPRGYRGCVEGGALVKADKLGCESGQAIIRYADRFYGVAGGTIYEGTSPLIKDPDYAEMVAGCRA